MQTTQRTPQKMRARSSQTPQTPQRSELSELHSAAKPPQGDCPLAARRIQAGANRVKSPLELNDRQVKILASSVTTIDVHIHEKKEGATISLTTPSVRAAEDLLQSLGFQRIRTDIWDVVTSRFVKSFPTSILLEVRAQAEIAKQGDEAVISITVERSGDILPSSNAHLGHTRRPARINE